MKTQESADKILDAIPPHYSKRWCNAGLCGCMGCANRSGGAQREGVTKEQWQDWRQRRFPNEYKNGFNTADLKAALKTVFDIKE